MKHLSALFLSAILVSSALAQPTILFSDIPVAQQYEWYSVTAPGTSDPTPNGANQIWNFTTASLLQLGTAVFKSAAGTPYAATYPDATHVIEFILTGGVTFSHTYLKVSALAIEVVARDVTGTSSVDYTDYKKMLQIPWAYLNNYMDDYTVSGGSPVSVTYTCSAYGNVISGIGLYNGVLKQTTSEGDIIFWNKTPFAPLITLPATGVPVVLKPITVGVEENSALQALSLFPNPATDMVRLSGLAQRANWSVIDATGRVVASGSVPAGRQQFDIPVALMAPGAYQVVVEAEGARRALPFMRQ